MRFNRAVVAAAILAASCGGSSPAAPTPASPPGGGLPLQATRYNLSILALGCRGNPETQILIPSVFITVTLQPDATGWTAVPANSNGTLSVRFLPAVANGNPAAQPVTGSAGGFVDDEGPTGSPSPNGTRLAIEGSVPLSGVLLTSDVASGQIDGPVAFTQRGITTTCGNGGAKWFLNRFNLS